MTEALHRACEAPAASGDSAATARAVTPGLLAKYERPVPRYTSYPTAPHFGPGVDARVYRDWLGALDGESLSLYLHVPFCRMLCWYCGCHTRIVNGYDPVAAYKDLLLREIDLVAAAAGGAGPVVQVHWGGGTPTILSPVHFLEITARLRDRFELAEGCDIAVEIDPRSLTREKLEALAASRVTRASIGVQDFRHEVQAAVNRIQPFEITERVVHWLREAGIADINFDLMYGLPHQTPESVVETVDRAVTLAPDRVALFGYAHVPWMKKHQRMLDESALPGTEARWRMAAAAGERLESHGYVPIGLDHFARPDGALAGALAAGGLHRNFQGYTADPAEVLIGLGASAIGTLPQGYVQNAPRLSDYRRAILADGLATERGIAVGPDDRLRRAVIERLMCYLEVDLDALCRDFGADAGAFDPALEQLAEMARDGLVTVDGARVRINPAARALVRVVCAAFDSYLETGRGRHSRAV